MAKKGGIVLFVVLISLVVIMSGCVKQPIEEEKPPEVDKEEDCKRNADCASDMVCKYDLCLEIGKEILTVDKLVQNKERFVSEYVYVMGKVSEPIPEVCTEMGCRKENPCCNECSSPLNFEGNSSKIIIKDGICRGSLECGLICTPLEKQKRYLLTGVWTHRTIMGRQYDQYWLKLDKFSLID